MFSRDMEVVAAAYRMALTLDDTILPLPDPNASAPVVPDPTLILQAIDRPEGLAGNV